MKLALVYDRVNKWGGAERVLAALHEIWPDAPLYTSVYSPDTAQWANGWQVNTTFLQNIPLPKNKHEYYPFLMGPAFETLSFDNYDVVISVTHEFAKAIITKPKTLHICYCLTPASYLWEPGYSQYFYEKDSLKLISGPLVKYLRLYDKIIAQRPDEYVAISKTVQNRINNIYGRDSEIIYPPVSINLITNSQSSITNDQYFLIVSRLVPNKRVDIAIKAFNELGWPLKIIGVGSEYKSLKRLGNKNVEFLGFLTNEEVISYYERCRAVVVCGEEDFNIVAVEAQGYGKPVVAFGRGGCTETVISGRTGYFFEEQRVSSLVRTLRAVNLETILSEDCVNNAKNYHCDQFKKEFRDYVLERFRQHLRNLQKSS